MGDSKEHGEDLDDRCLDDGIYEGCITRVRYGTTGRGVGTRPASGGGHILCKVGAADKVPEKLGEETAPEASPENIDGGEDVDKLGPLVPDKLSHGDTVED